MIPTERELAIQSYVDGELAGRQAEEVARWIEEDPEARELAESLRSVTALLQGGESVLALDESEDFYWSRIRDGILSAEHEHEGEQAFFDSAPTAPSASWLNWGRWLIPAVAVPALVIVFSMFQKPAAVPENSGIVLALEHEIDLGSPDASYMTFRSEKEGMTVVWLQTHGE